jgi:hypothetical protein
MSSNTAALPIPTNLRDYILKYENVNLNDTVPASPGGSTNVAWQRDEFGNISANVTSGGGGGLGPADYNVTNPGEFTFPAPVVIDAPEAVGPTTITDTGGSGGFQVNTDSNSGGIGLNATGFSGINLSAQANSSFDVAGNLNLSADTLTTNGPLIMTSPAADTPLVVKAPTGLSVNLVKFESHTGAFVSGVNKTADLVLSPTNGAPADTPIANSCRFDAATGTLYIFDGSAWKSTVLV